MTSKPTGGDAFPSSIAATPPGDIYQPYPGMTLRDWFAGHALNAILATQQSQANISKIAREDGMDPALFAAEAAYGFADAMIKERDK